MFFVRLFDLRLFGFVCFIFLFPLVSVKDCGLWLWHSLDFSLTLFRISHLPLWYIWKWRSAHIYARGRRQSCKLHYCLWRVSIKPRLTFSNRSMFFVSKGNFFDIIKTRIFKYIENFTSKNWNISDKKKHSVFHISAQNIDCAFSLEPPRRGGSNKYPQSMFLIRNKKKNVHPCIPQFYYIKWGLRGSILYRYDFVMTFINCSWLARRCVGHRTASLFTCRMVSRKPDWIPLYSQDGESKLRLTPLAPPPPPPPAPVYLHDCDSDIRLNPSLLAGWRVGHQAEWWLLQQIGAYLLFSTFGPIVVQLLAPRHKTTFLVLN